MIHRIFAILLLLTVAPCFADELLPVVQPLDVDAQKAPQIFMPRIADNSIAIDGKLNDAAWQKAALVEGFKNEVGEQGKTLMRVAYDYENLYFAFICHMDNTNDLVADAKAGTRDEHIWGDHCIDMKLATGAGETQILINSEGAWSDSLKGDLSWNPHIEVATSKNAKVWFVEMKLRAGSLWLPAEFEGRFMNIAVGRAGPGEVLQTLTKPYGRTDTAARFIFGEKDAYERVKDQITYTQGSTLRFIMDREVYPRFCERGLGRLRLLRGSGDPLSNAMNLQLAVVKNGKDITTQLIDNGDASAIDFEMDLTSLPVGTYQLEARLLDGDSVFHTQSRRLVIREEPVETAGRISLTIPAGPVDLPSYGYTFGVPMPWGALTSTDHVKLLDGNGHELPMQAEVTSRWSRNGHIRWLLIDTVAPMCTQSQSLTLEYGPRVSRQPITSPLQLSESNDEIKIDSGELKLLIAKTKTPGLVSLDGRSTFVKPDPESGPYMIDSAGKVYRGINDPNPIVTIEANGPIKAQVSVNGWHYSEDGEKLGRFILRYIAYRGLSTVQMDHTFIITEGNDTQYADIGYVIPTNARQGIFGAPRLTPYLLDGPNDSAYLIQLDDLHGKIYQGGKFVDEFGKADGWMSAGGLHVSVRDFWQNFPKELEARQDRVILHFWPGHGEQKLRTGNRLSRRNAYQHWFAHEGKFLDFRVPDEYLKLIESDEYSEQASKTNPVGVSKTHQVLLHVGTWNWEADRAPSMAKAFDSNPTIVCDPQWVCDSKVFGDIGPQIDGQHEEVEAAIDGTMETIARQNVEDRDFGMWVFGDAHHNWLWSERRIRLYRTWRQTHHNWPRWPWLQYARSGDKWKFDYASRNGRNVVDVAHAHHTDEENEALRYPAGKLVGGICDYKGFVKWAAGNRLGYNSVADSMLHQYYFTGDRRALETATEHVHRILESDQAHEGREGSARITSLVAYYLNTWDNDALELLERHVDAYVKAQEPTGLIASRPLLSFWTLGFIRYTDLTRSTRGELLTTRWADLILNTDRNTRLYRHMQILDSPLSSIQASLAQAYVYTGDEKYLRMAKTRAKRFYDITYQGDDARYVGLTGSWNRSLPWSFYLTDLPHYVYALNKHGSDIEPMPLPDEQQIATLYRHKIDGKTWWTFHAILKQENDQPFEIDFMVRKHDHIVELAALDGSGEVVRITPKPSETEGWEHIQATIPSDGIRVYAFRMRTTASYAEVEVPITTGSSDMKEVYPLKADGQNIYLTGGEWMYFDIPQGANEVTFRMIGRDISEGQIRNSKKEVVAANVWIAANGTQYLTAPATGSTKGWSLRYRADGTRDRFQLLSHITPATADRPLYLSTTPDRFFWPSRDELPWQDGQ